MSLYQPSDIPGLFLEEENPLFTNLLYQSYLGNIPENIESYIGQRPSSVSGIMNLYSPQDFSGVYRQFSPAQIAEANYQITNSGLQPKAPPPKPQGIETIADLARRYNLSPDIVAQFSQQNKPRSEPRPTFYGYSGDLSGLTGRWLGQSELGLDSGRGRPETYADVLARAKIAEQERGRD